jgi:hypothetical protein
VEREEALPASMRLTEAPEIGESPPLTVPLTLNALLPLLPLLVLMPEFVPVSELDLFPQELNKRETERKTINKIPNFFMPIFFITENPPSGKNLSYFSARDEDSLFLKKYYSVYHLGILFKSSCNGEITSLEEQGSDWDLFDLKFLFFIISF